MPYEFFGPTNDRRGMFLVLFFQISRSLAPTSDFSRSVKLRNYFWQMIFSHLFLDRFTPFNPIDRTDVFFANLSSSTENAEFARMFDAVFSRNSTQNIFMTWPRPRPYSRLSSKLDVGFSGRFVFYRISPAGEIP